jgi:plastocyanin domain-containing protein
MDGLATFVLGGGIGAIAFVLWYFFGPKKQIHARPTQAGVQEVNILVKGSYSPDVIVVEKGRPVRLTFYRDETASCSEQIILSDFGIARDLPAYKTTSVEFTPNKAGEFSFTCGMRMMRGKLVVNEA